MNPNQWAHDLRFAWRGLIRARGFTAAAVVTLAIGIAGTTVMFTLIRGVLLRPLPIPQEERVIVVWQTPVTGVASHVPFRGLDVDAVARESGLIESAAGIDYHVPFEREWADGGTPVPLKTSVVQGEFFRVAAVAPLLGRTLTRDDDAAGAERVAVLAHRAWRRAFAAAPSVIGRRLQLGLASDHPRGGAPSFTIVGVMPEGFDYPTGAELWVTPHAYASTVSNAAFREGLLRDMNLVARLRPGVTFEQAARELPALIQRLPQAVSFDLAGFRTVVRPIKSVVVGDVGSAMAALFAAVGLVLLIASANVANLLLMRGEARRAELIVRTALGAGRWRLARELFLESVLLCVAGGVAGFAIASSTLGVVITIVPNGLPRVDSIRIDAVVVAFTAAIALLSGVISSIAPVLAASRLDLQTQIRSGGRGIAAGGARARRALVVAQVGLAVTTVAAAGLLARSLLRLQSVDTGMAADRIVVVELTVPGEKFDEAARRRELLRSLITELEAVPGIDGATPINAEPFAGTNGWDVPRFVAEGQTPDRFSTNPALNLESVHPAYFATMEIPIVRGRAFSAADREGAPRATIISDDLANLLWPGDDPIGRRLKMGGPQTKGDWWTVVGVAAVTRYRELATPRPTMYVPAEQFMITLNRLAVRSSAPLPVVADVVRSRVRAVDPDVRVARVDRFVDLMAAPLARPRFNTLLIGVFGAAALLLSTVGIYAVMATFVRQRLGEIGVRVALGASAGDVRRLVLGEGLRLTLAGALIGLAGAVAGARVLRGLLFDVHPLDPVTLGGAVLALIVTTTVAAYLPARRAASTDPVSMLRSE